MKLNYKRTFIVGLAFLSICVPSESYWKARYLSSAHLKFPSISSYKNNDDSKVPKQAINPKKLFFKPKNKRVKL